MAPRTLMLSNVALALLVFVGQVSCQSSSDRTLGSPCTGSNNYCAGGPIILRCSGGKLVAGNCNDNLGEPVGGATCVESSVNAGDAQCKANLPASSSSEVPTATATGGGDSGNQGTATSGSSPIQSAVGSAVSTSITPSKQSPPPSTGTTLKAEPANANTSQPATATSNNAAPTLPPNSNPTASGNEAAVASASASATGTGNAPPDQSSSAAAKSGLSSTAKLGIGLGVPLGVLALALVGVAAFLLRRKKNSNTSLPPAYEEAGMAAELPALPSSRPHELPAHQVYEAPAHVSNENKWAVSGAHELAG